MSITTAPWHVVTSRKPNQRGMAFLMFDETFVLKVYKDGVPDAKEFAEYLARQFNKIQERRYQAPLEPNESLIVENLSRGGVVCMGHAFAQGLRPEFLARLTEDYLVVKGD